MWKRQPFAPVRDMPSPPRRGADPHTASGLIFGLVLVGSCLFSGCSSDSPVAGAVEAETLQRSTVVEPIVSMNDLDLSFLGPDSVAGVVVMPKRLLERDWARDPVIREPFEKWLRLAVSDGLDWTKCDRVSVALSGVSSPGTIPVIVRAEWSESIDMSEVFAGRDEVTRREDGSQVYWELGESGAALWQENDRTLWITGLDRVRALPTRQPPTNRLARALAARPLTSDLEAVVDLATVREQAGAMDAPTGGDSQVIEIALEKAKLLEVKVDTSIDRCFEARTSLGDARLAEDLRKWGRSRIAQSTTALTALAAFQSASLPEEVGAAVSGLLNAVTQGIQIEAQEEDVVLSLTVPSEVRGQMGVLIGYAVEQQEKLVAQANLTRVAAAIETYVAQNNDLPRDLLNDAGEPILSWRVRLLPLLDQQALYDEFALDEPWDSETNQPLVARMPSVFGDDSDHHSHVLAFAGESMAAAPGRTGLPSDPAEGTLAFIQTYGDQSETWSAPGGLLEFEADALKRTGDSAFPSVNVITADGKLHALSRWTRLKSIEAMLTADGGEELDLDEVFGTGNSERPSNRFLNRILGN